LRWVAWKAAMRVDLGTAESWKAGRSCWASGRATGELAAVDSMRWEEADAGTACRSSVGRMMEAIVQECRGVETQQHLVGTASNGVDNASGLEC
jgi:hypothetical protein